MSLPSIEEVYKYTDDLIQREQEKAKPKTYERPTIEQKAAYYVAVRDNDHKALTKAYEGLGGIPALDPDLGFGSIFLPRNLSSELLTEPTELNTLRQIERVSNIHGLIETVLSYEIDEATLADITDKETAREIETSGNAVAYERFKTKLIVVLKDTVLYGSQFDLAAEVDKALQTALATKEKMNAFRTVADGVHDHMSFYLNGIRTITRPDLIDSIIEAWADLPEAYAVNATCVMKKSDYYRAIKKLSNDVSTLWGKKPENVLGIPVVFNDYAVKPIIGDFDFARLNYDIGAYFDRDSDARKGENYFVLTAWGDHRIRLKSAFRIAEVA